MTTDIATTNALDRYRTNFSANIKAAADMHIHDLLDNFQRLTKIIDAHETTYEKHIGRTWDEEGQLAIRERNIYASVANARFGITFNAYEPSDTNW